MTAHDDRRDDRAAMRRPLPLGPLLAVCEQRIQLWGMRRGDALPTDGNSRFRKATDQEVGELLGVSRHTVLRWKQIGTIKLSDADRCAIRLGTHPALIWPEFTYIYTEDDDS